jgi:5,10-methylene-tetrahydrofolate dehydrogenase/methenyl tetrahydrofolate cyclohydrolase
LYKSHNFEIGKEQIRIARLRVTPEIEIKEGKNITGYMFGVPWTVENLVKKNLIYSMVLDTDVDNMTPIEETHKFNSSDIFIPILPDFIEREYRYTYYLVSDITASIGGIGGFIKPILVRLVQIFIMSFLY